MCIYNSAISGKPLPTYHSTTPAHAGPKLALTEESKLRSPQVLRKVPPKNGGSIITGVAFKVVSIFFSIIPIYYITPL